MFGHKKIFICLIGTDGSGKSTLAQKAEDILKEHNISAKQTWGAYDLMLLKPIVKLAKKILLKQDDGYKDYDKYTESINKATKNSFIKKAYQFLILTEYLVELTIKVTLPLFFGKSIISDRYVYDTATNICSNLNTSFGVHTKLIKRLLMFCPTPDIFLYVDVPEEISMQRKDDIPSVEYIRKRKKYYTNIVNCFYPQVLDGTDSLDSLDIILSSIIEEKLQIK